MLILQHIFFERIIYMFTHDKQSDLQICLDEKLGWKRKVAVVFLMAVIAFGAISKCVQQENEDAQKMPRPVLKGQSKNFDVKAVRSR